MNRALTLARRGAGRTSPNPMVGCVVARGGEIVGQGWHLFEKRDHAEVVALSQAGDRARGADLYVTLEPCCHHGRTPPCVDLIARSGVGRVFVAVADPNPLVSGRGVESLRQRGIQVHEGLLGEKAAKLNEAFFHFMRHRAPFATLKLALTLDGKIATASGDSKWITGERSRLDAQRLRYESDAILVGVGTILADDPSLDVRWRRRNSICKIVLDSRLRTPPAAKLFESGDRVVIFHAPDAAESRRSRLGDKACLLEAPVDGQGQLGWRSILEQLAARRITSLIVEGGSQVAASALRAGAVQRIRFYYAPKIIGGRDLCGVGDLGVARLSEALPLRNLRVKSLPPDFRLEADFGLPETLPPDPSSE